MTFDIEQRLERVSPLARRVYVELGRVDLGFMASSVAYQAFLSLVPLLVSVFLLVAVVGGPGLAGAVLSLGESFLPAPARRLLERSVTAEITANATSVISLALLVWGSLGLFTGLKTAFATIYRTTASNSLGNQISNALLAYVVVLVAATGAVGAAGLSVRSRLPFVELLSSVVLFGGLVVVFLPLYYRFPDVPTTVRGTLPGAGIAALGWVLLQALFQLYVRFAADPNLSGALGAMLLVLAWLYFGSYVVLFGAIVNYALGHERRQRR